MRFDCVKQYSCDQELRILIIIIDYAIEFELQIIRLDCVKNLLKDSKASNIRHKSCLLKQILIKLDRDKNNKT